MGAIQVDPMARPGRTRARGRRRRPVPAARPEGASDDELRPAAKAYIAAVIGLAVGLAAAALRAAPPTDGDLPLAAAIAACSALAWRFPIPFARRTKLYLDTAVVVAAVLLLSPGLAMLAAGSGPLLAAAVGRRPPDVVEAAFNAAQSMLVALAGALILRAAGWDPAHPAFLRPLPLLALPVAAVAMHLLSVLAVSTFVAVQTGRRARPTFWLALLEDPRAEALAQASLTATGVLAALIADAYPWALALLIVPVVATYVTLHRQLQLRQAAEQARLMSDAGMSEAQRLARLGSWEWEPASGRQAWSDEVYRTFGLTAGVTTPSFETFLAAVHPDDRVRVERAMHDACAVGEPLQIEYRVWLPNGRERLVHQRCEARPGGGGRPPRVVGTVQDVTEQRALEARVREVAERERTAAELTETRLRLAAIREEERLRLARALHDGPMQDLLAITYQLACLSRVTIADLPDGQALPGVENVRQSVLGVVGELRDVVRELRPAGLAEFGLPTALEGFVAALRRPAEGGAPAIALDLDPATADLPPPLSLALFHIAQEAIRNAVRHADAREVVVRLREEGEEVTLSVRDDGAGFRPPERLGAFADHGHYGLVGMAERVDQVGGRLTIDSSPLGTTVAVRAPLARAAENHA